MVMANGMLNGVSSRTMSKDVFSSHYYGPAYPGTTLDLIPEGAPFKNASMELFPLSYGFKNKCSAQTWDKLMDYSVDLAKIGDYVVFATSGNKFAFHKDDWEKYGYAHNPDESMDRMDGWIGATVGPHAIEYVKPNKEIGLFELPEYTPSYSKYPAMTDVRVPIKDLAGTVPINKVGKYISRIANLEQDLRDVIFSDYPKAPGFNPETEAFLESLISKGIGPGREIEAIGVENLEKAIARTYMTNRTADLVASTDIYQKALNIAEAYGLKGEEAVRFAKRAVWYHEFYHVFDHRKFASRGKKEIDVGEFLAEFFTERAGVVDEKTAKYYRALAEYNKDYAKGWRKGRIKNLIESLAKQYASEAKDMGMNEDEARDYVGSKLEEEIENLEKSKLEEAVESKENEGRKAKAGANGKHSEEETNSRDAQGQADEQEAASEAPAE